MTKAGCVLAVMTGWDATNPQGLIYAFALCVALRLTYMESVEFIAAANYTFSNRHRYDLIFKYVLENRIYDLDTSDEFLFAFQFPCMGE